MVSVTGGGGANPPVTVGEPRLRRRIWYILRLMFYADISAKLAEDALNVLMVSVTGGVGVNPRVTVGEPRLRRRIWYILMFYVFRIA